MRRGERGGIGRQLGALAQQIDLQRRQMERLAQVIAERILAARPGKPAGDIVRRKIGPQVDVQRGSAVAGDGITQ